MSIQRFLWHGLTAGLVGLALAGPAQAQLGYGLGSSSPYGRYGPYITRPYAASAGIYGGVAGRGFNSIYRYDAFPAYYGNNYQYGLYFDTPIVNRYPGGGVGVGGYASPYYTPGYSVTPSLGALAASAGVGREAYYPATVAQGGVAGEPARIEMKLPTADADVWVQGARTKQTGLTREFVSPPLEAGSRYRYTIRATWTENGQQRTRTQALEIAPGGSYTVVFNEPDKE